MPKTNSIHTVESTTLRRSPRFLLQRSATEAPQQPKTPRKAEDSKSFHSKSTHKLVRCSNLSSPTTPQIVPSTESHKGSKNKSSKKLNDSDSKSGNYDTALTRLRRSSRLNNGASGFSFLRQSSRLSLQTIVFHELKDSSRKGMKQSTKPHNSLGDSEKVAPGPRKSATLNNPVQSLRRSQRLLNQKNVSSPPYQMANNSKSVETVAYDSDCSVEEETDQIVARPAKVQDKSVEKSSGKGEKMTRDVSITREKFTTQGREVQVRHEDKSDGPVKGKRKRDEDSEATKKGWTKEQEVALQKAYFAAKPTPHFWKKVSKLVPGKSAKDCFDRIHQDHATPPQHQPRSRSKRMNSSPLEQVSLSASKLLKPFVNKARRSSCFKSKSYLTQESLKKLLQCYNKVDRDQEGDLFSVLEPNVDFSSNAFLPSDALSTPRQLDEKQGRLQSCSEKSSSSHGKSLSRFSSSGDPDIVSPPVLKQVKNRELHEKYINQLRCREARRRRAASARVELSKTGKAVREESNVQKRGMVESAKIALVSEARDAIQKFQHSQANLMGNCNSDEDIDDSIEAEGFDDEDGNQ